MFSAGGLHNARLGPAHTSSGSLPCGSIGHSSSKRHLQAVARGVEQASTLLRLGQQHAAGSRLVDDPTAGCQVAAAAAAPAAVTDQQQQDLSCLVQQSCMEDERQQRRLQQQQHQQHSHIQHAVLQQQSVQLSHWALPQPDLVHTQQDQQQDLLLEHQQQQHLSQGPAAGALHDAAQVDFQQETSSSCSSFSLPEQQQHPTLQQGQQVDFLGLQELRPHNQQLGQDNPMQQQQQPAPQQPVAQKHHQLVVQQQQCSNLQQQQQPKQQPRQKLRPQQQQKRPHKQPRQQQQQRNSPSSQSVREFRVANSTQPADLANALRLWLKQHDTHQHRKQQQQQSTGKPHSPLSTPASSRGRSSSSSSRDRSSAGGGVAAAAVQGIPDVLVCCSSKAALHTALQAVGLASQQASSLQRPYQLLLQPQVLHQALPVPAAEPAGPAAGFLAQYQLRLSWVPSQPQAVQLQQQQQRPQQQQRRQQQQQQEPQQGCQLQGGAACVDVSVLLQSQHCRLLQCDHLVSPSSSSSSSSRKKKSKKRKQPKAATSTAAAAAEGTTPAQPAVDQDSSSSSSSTMCQQQQPAPCAPADSLYQLEWQLLRLLQGNWPTGLLCSTSVGALAAVKALVGASRHLAAGGQELFVAVQAVDCGGPSAAAAGASTAAAGAGAQQAGTTGVGSSSSSGVVLWAVAAVSSSSSARLSGVTTPLAATEHQLLARTRSKQQQRMQQQQQQEDLQAGMGGQDYQQTVQQEHLLPPPQQQQQVHSSPVPSTAAFGQPLQQEQSVQQEPEGPVLRQQAAWPQEQQHGSVQLPAHIPHSHAVECAAAVPAVDAAGLHHIAESAVSSSRRQAPAAVAAATPPEQLQPLC